MATSKTMAVQGALAHNRALAVVERIGDPELVEQLQSTPVDRAHPGFPMFLYALQATLIAGLAGMVEEQGKQIAEQDRRLAALEGEAGSAPATKTTATKTKTAKKGA